MGVYFCSRLRVTGYGFCTHSEANSLTSAVPESLILLLYRLHLLPGLFLMLNYAHIFWHYISDLEESFSLLAVNTHIRLFLKIFKPPSFPMVIRAADSATQRNLFFSQFFPHSKLRFWYSLFSLTLMFIV